MQKRSRSTAAVTLTAGVALATLASTLVTVVPASAAPPGKVEGYSAEIRRTAYGVPHITAADYASAGFGSGFVQAEDNVCIIAEKVVTANGTRAQDLGPTAANVQSDLFVQNALASGAVERLLEGTPDGVDAPSQDARDLVRGFVAGYNRVVRTQPTDDPACAGKPWVRQISEIEFWRTMYASMVRAGSRALQGGILAANPPAVAAAAVSTASTAAIASAPDGTSAGIGSNAYGLGREATVSGAGMVLGNPHFPWDGPERFYRLHITIPGEYDVEGATLVGDPMVEIGHNATVGWSHTVSTARRFAWHRLALVPATRRRTTSTVSR
jgi:acyl-homoserine-lactone acylase